MKRTRWARAFALVAVLAIVAAACGDDDDDSNETLKVGGVAQVSFFAGIEEGGKARIEEANKTCVQGHKLEWVGMRDDASDSQKNIDALRDLVENEGVFAVIATSANLTTPSTNYLNENKVPFFGWGFMPGFCGEESWGYGFNGCLSGFALDAVGAMELPGAKLNGSLT